jgi:peptidoglycan/xylan/chitin deacetylase (PgdA/CDA1 family)
MKKIRAVILIFIFLAAVSGFSGCAKSEAAAEAEKIFEYEEATLESKESKNTADDEINKDELNKIDEIIETTDEVLEEYTEETSPPIKAAVIELSSAEAAKPPETVTAAPETTAAEPETAVTEPVPPKPQRHPEDKVIALTFDDGPSKYTEQILDILAQYDGKATFFVLGMKVWNNRQTVRNIIGQGSEIAGHSWHHYNLTALEEQEIKDQITYTDNAIYQVTEIRPPKFFRAPYGAFDDIVKEAAREAGAAFIQWSIDPRDWRERDADYIYDYIMERAESGNIILCHDIYESTAEAMERVIPDLIEQGYRLITVSELLGGTVPGRVYYSETHSID